MIRRALILALAAGMALGTAGCSVGKSIHEHPCPPAGTSLTYDNFGRGFVAEWCVRCHGGANGYSSRAFTSLDSIRSQRDRIFINAAADNGSMPPGPDGPSQTERNELADWLACGAP